jgi:hypothetical protein
MRHVLEKRQCSQLANYLLELPALITHFLPGARIWYKNCHLTQVPARNDVPLLVVAAPVEIESRLSSDMTECRKAFGHLVTYFRGDVGEVNEREIFLWIIWNVVFSFRTSSKRFAAFCHSFMS